MLKFEKIGNCNKTAYSFLYLLVSLTECIHLAVWATQQLAGSGELTALPTHLAPALKTSSQLSEPD